MAKILYSAPLKALSQEKYEDWTKLFPDKKILQLTGDTLTSQKIRMEMMKAAETADILIMTAELLDSITRNHYSEHYQWVKHVQLLVVDEAHGVTMEGRGHVIEASIMRFCEIAPQAKVWFMSATMPNCEEFAQWLTTLNHKPSEIINSTWRPTELRWNFIPHNAFGSYWENQDDKIRKAVEIVEEHKNESTLVFVHDKNTGRRIDAILKELGIACEFYNADLDTETRHDLLKRFESDNGDRIAALISTSALAWGSLHEDTVITTVYGTQKIDKIKPGTAIVSYNEANHCWEWDEVVHIEECYEQFEIVIELENGSTIIAGESHPIYVQLKDGSFINKRADQLTTEDQLVEMYVNAKKISF